MAQKSSPKKHDFISHFARVGYAAKAFTYVLLAYMVWRAAEAGERAGNTRRAMGVVDRSAALGDIVLVAIAIGLGGYAIWKLYCAVLNPEDDKWTKRVGCLFIASINAGLAWQAVLLFTTQHGSSGGPDQAAHWSAVVMRYPLGIWAVGIAGICILGYGVRQIYRGIISKLDDQLRLYRLDKDHRHWAVVVSRIGIAARGFVFGLIGLFLVRASLRADPSQARDFGDSIQELGRQPAGHFLLLAVAAGLVAYAVYELIRALYREIPTQ
jgi:uncharacterized membrane protein